MCCRVKSSLPHFLLHLFLSFPFLSFSIFLFISFVFPRFVLVISKFSSNLSLFFWYFRVCHFRLPSDPPPFLIYISHSFELIISFISFQFFVKFISSSFHSNIWRILPQFVVNLSWKIGQFYSNFWLISISNLVYFALIFGRLKLEIWSI